MNDHFLFGRFEIRVFLPHVFYWLGVILYVVYFLLPTVEFAGYGAIKGHELTYMIASEAIQFSNVRRALISMSILGVHATIALNFICYVVGFRVIQFRTAFVLMIGLAWLLFITFIYPEILAVSTFLSGHFVWLGSIGVLVLGTLFLPRPAMPEPGYPGY